MEENKNEEVVEETTQNQTEETPQVDESKFESAGDDSVVKVDLSQPPKTEENEQPTNTNEEDVVQEKVIEETTNQEEAIEQVAEENPDDLVKFHVSPSEKLTSSTISELINKANLNKDHEESLSEIIENLYLMFTEGDCDLVEVNPLAITDNGVMALDSKVALDMNAKFKHEKYEPDVYNKLIKINALAHEIHASLDKR